METDAGKEDMLELRITSNISTLHSERRFPANQKVRNRALISEHLFSSILING